MKNSLLPIVVREDGLYLDVSRLASAQPSNTQPSPHDFVRPDASESESPLTATWPSSDADFDSLESDRSGIFEPEVPILDKGMDVDAAFDRMNAETMDTVCRTMRHALWELGFTLPRNAPEVSPGDEMWGDYITFSLTEAQTIDFLRMMIGSGLLKHTYSSALNIASPKKGLSQRPVCVRDHARPGDRSDVYGRHRTLCGGLAHGYHVVNPPDGERLFEHPTEVTCSICSEVSKNLKEHEPARDVQPDLLAK